MANVLPKDKQIAVISALAEGSSIRSIERITGVDCVSYIDDLRDVIRNLHGVEAKHVESVPVKEVFQGKTVWEGIVEVFDLPAHPKAPRVYAWTHDTDDPKEPKRHVTVLHIHPVVSPFSAVRAAIIQEFKNRVPEES